MRFSSWAASRIPRRSEMVSIEREAVNFRNKPVNRVLRICRRPRRTSRRVVLRPSERAFSVNGWDRESRTIESRELIH